MATYQEFSIAHSVLANLVFYSFNIEELRKPADDTDQNPILRTDGSNLAKVFSVLEFQKRGFKPCFCRQRRGRR